MDRVVEERPEPNEWVAVPVRVLRELEESLDEIRALLDEPQALRVRLRALEGEPV